MKKFTSSQEFFDAAWRWLVTDDNPKCVNDLGRCLYRKRDMDGGKEVVLSCVIGSMIPDDLIHATTETSIGWLWGNSPKIREWFSAVNPHLMVEVQGIHDQDRPRVKTLHAIAECYDLVVPV
jgi:hypothetical protein